MFVSRHAIDWRTISAFEFEKEVNNASSVIHSDTKHLTIHSSSPPPPHPFSSESLVACLCEEVAAGPSKLLSENGLDTRRPCWDELEHSKVLDLSRAME